MALNFGDYLKKITNIFKPQGGGGGGGGGGAGGSALDGGLSIPKGTSPLQLDVSNDVILGPAPVAQPPVNNVTTPTGNRATVPTSGTSGGGTAPQSAELMVPGTSGEPALSAEEVEAQRRAAEEAEIARLTPLYEAQRQSILSQDPILEKSYSTSTGTIRDAINAAKGTADRQSQYVRDTFGDMLRKVGDQYNTLRGKAINTYNDLNRQRQNLFTNLGTLDSSAFGEQQFRSDQQLAGNLTDMDMERIGQVTQTEREREKSIGDIQDKFGEYERGANAELANLALQYQEGKNQIQQALVQNDLQGAAAIQSALDNLTQRAQQIKDDIAARMTDFANQAGLLQAQGVKVNTNLGGVTGSDFASRLSSALTDAQNRVYGQLANVRLNRPTQQSTQGVQGFISPSGEKFNSYSDYLRALLFNAQP